MTQFKWTNKLKQVARKQLLSVANNYEVKRRKVLVGVKFYSDGRARWIGQAHDYTVDLSVERK